MMLVTISWYLFALFMYLLLVFMTIMVAPGSGFDRTLLIIQVALLLLASASAVAAILLHRLFKRNPTAHFFRSKSVRAIAIGIAVIFTLLAFSQLVFFMI